MARLRTRDLLQDGESVARGMAGHPTRWQVPGVAEGASVLIDPSAVDESAVLVRMRSRRPSSQMPPLGTVVRDQPPSMRLRRGWGESMKLRATSMC
jgi:hypothetical protein